MHTFFDVGRPTRSVDNGAVQGTSDDLDMRSSVALFPCSMGNVSSSVSGADILIGQSQVSGWFSMRPSSVAWSQEKDFSSSEICLEIHAIYVCLWTSNVWVLHNRTFSVECTRASNYIAHLIAFRFSSENIQFGWGRAHLKHYSSAENILLNFTDSHLVSGRHWAALPLWGQSINCTHFGILRFKLCSTSPPGGNQVDGLPPAQSLKILKISKTSNFQILGF